LFPCKAETLQGLEAQITGVKHWHYVFWTGTLSIGLFAHRVLQKAVDLVDRLGIVSQIRKTSEQSLQHWTLAALAQRSKL
jgi:hypothetical protein